MSELRYTAWCKGLDEGPEDGRPYSEDDAESTEIAAARYALFYAKRWCAPGVHDLAVVVRDAESQADSEVRVRVEPHPSGAWGWRVALLSREN